MGKNAWVFACSGHTGSALGLQVLCFLLFGEEQLELAYNVHGLARQAHNLPPTRFVLLHKQFFPILWILMPWDALSHLELCQPEWWCVKIWNHAIGPGLNSSSMACFP